MLWGWWSAETTITKALQVRSRRESKRHTVYHAGDELAAGDKGVVDNRELAAVRGRRHFRQVHGHSHGGDANAYPNQRAPDHELQHRLRGAEKNRASNTGVKRGRCVSDVD